MLFCEQLWAVAFSVHWTGPQPSDKQTDRGFAVEKKELDPKAKRLFYRPFSDQTLTFHTCAHVWKNPILDTGASQNEL